MNIGAHELLIRRIGGAVVDGVRRKMWQIRINKFIKLLHRANCVMKDLCKG